MSYISLQGEYKMAWYTVILFDYRGLFQIWKVYGDLALAFLFNSAFFVAQ